MWFEADLAISNNKSDYVETPSLAPTDTLSVVALIRQYKTHMLHEYNIVRHCNITMIRILIMKNLIHCDEKNHCLND